MQFWINSVKSIKDVHSNSWFLTDCKWAHIKSNFPALHRLQMFAWRQPLSTLSITNGGMFCSSKPCFWASSAAAPRVLLSPRRVFMTSAWRMQLRTRSSWLGEIMWLATILAAVSHRSWALSHVAVVKLGGSFVCKPTFAYSIKYIESRKLTRWNETQPAQVASHSPSLIAS